MSMIDIDLEGYVEPTPDTEGRKLLRIQDIEKKVIEWDDKNTGEHKVRDVVQLVLAIQDAEVENPNLIYHSFFLPHPDEDFKSNNWSKGKIIKFKEAVGDTSAGGIDEAAVRMAEVYANVGVKLNKKTEEPENYIKGFVPAA